MSIFKKLFKKEKEKTPDSNLQTFTVKKVIRETDKAVSLVFDKPENGFNFLPGQYLTLEKEIDGQLSRRAYSLCSQPNENELVVTVKETPNGFFSKYVNRDVKARDTFNVLPPSGQFTFQADSSKNRHIVGFAGGSGITPILSILVNLLENEPNSRFSLVYGNKTESEIIFNDRLNALSELFGARFQLIHVLSDVEENPYSEFTGFVNQEMINQLNEKHINLATADCIYLCGPGEMIQSIENSLGEVGVAASKIKKELFSAPIATATEASGQKEGEVVCPSNITIIYNNESHDLIYENSNKTLLDLALDNGIKAPFSCMNGVCSTCSAKLEKGTVAMDQNFALEPEDVADGYILTCQSKPTAAQLTINWDDNKM